MSVSGGRDAASLCVCVYDVCVCVCHRVDGGSPAEVSGLKSGDQILAVNGHSFVSILHQEAVAVLRAYTTLVITVRVSTPLCMCVYVYEGMYVHYNIFSPVSGKTASSSES